MTDPSKPLAWISADLCSAVTARQVENIPELGGDPTGLYPIPLARMTDAALAAIQPEMVKPLEWRELYADQRAFPKTWHGSSRVFGTIYPITQMHPSDGFFAVGAKYASLENAQGACQSNFAARILSALSPAFLARIEALEAALEPFVGSSANAGRDGVKLIHKKISGLAPIQITVTKDQWYAARRIYDARAALNQSGGQTDASE
jgi:hypothetical protein